MKKFIAVIITICIFISCTIIPVTAQTTQTQNTTAAATVVKSGKLGKKLTWSFDSDGTLTIDGNGKMPDYKDDTFYEGANYIFITYTTKTPWADLREQIKKVIIKDGITYIGSYSFSYLTALETVTIGKSVKTIGASAFEGVCNVKSINLPQSVEKIGFRAFAVCRGLREVKLPKNLKVIENSAFGDCRDLYGVKLPNSLTFIGSGAFKFCKSLAEIKIPEKITKIESETFAFCEYLRKVEIPGNVKTIDYAAFSCCDYLKTLKLGEGIEEIGDYAFDDAISIRKVRIPKSVKKIGKEAFGYVGVGEENEYESLKRINYTFYGYSGSAAEKYAKDNGFKFVAYKKVGSVKLSKTTFTYDGKTHQPKVTVKDANGKTLEKGKDYSVKYSKDCKNVGQYTVTVKFKGNYDGTKKLTFKIVPKGTSVSKLTAGKKSFTVKWKKQATQTTGYQIRYSTSSNMKNAEKVKVGKNTTTSLKVKNLKGGKTYYVQVRTYKTVKVDGKNVKIYSSWSNAKSVKTK